MGLEGKAGQTRGTGNTGRRHRARGYREGVINNCDLPGERGARERGQKIKLERRLGWDPGLRLHRVGSQGPLKGFEQGHDTVRFMVYKGDSVMEDYQ